MCGHLKTGHREAAGTSGFYAFMKSLFIVISALSQREFRLCAPAAWAKLQDMPLMEQAIEHGCDRGCIPQQFAPVFDRPIGGHERAGALVAPHDDL